MKEINLKLVKTQENITEDKTVFKYIYKPETMNLNGTISVTVEATDPYEYLDVIGFPMALSDTVTITAGKTSTQGKLPTTSKKEDK